MIGRCYGCRKTWKLDRAIMWTLCPACGRPLKLIANQKEIKASLDAFMPIETTEENHSDGENVHVRELKGWCPECGGSGWCKKCGGFG